MRWIQPISKESDKREQKTELIKRNEIKNIGWKCVLDL